MKRLKFWGAIFIFIIILLNPETAVAGAQGAMRTWYGSVAPALFPFLALMPLLTSEEACASYEAIFSKWMRPLFRMSGAAAPAVIVGMITGSPGGALALRRIAVNSGLSASEVKRIALTVGGVSPAYLIMGVGLGLYDSMPLGLKLAGIQLVIQILMLIAMPVQDCKAGHYDLPHAVEKENPIRNAVESLLAICGYMVLFSVVAKVAAGFIGENMGLGLLLILDLPSGLAELAKSEIAFGIKRILQGAAIGLSGLCIMAQNMDVLKSLGVKWKEYFCVRSISAGMFACAGILMEEVRGAELVNQLMGVKTTYAFSLLAASLVIIPAIFLITRNLFLNNQKFRNECSK